MPRTMYTNCIFCHEFLGTNERVENFPIGRRLAFDPAKGRLWVVCRRCWQWNLTPLEERWEAVEDCERLYRSARTRVATSEIGLAHLMGGFELIRIGAPQQPEFAAWRFCHQFGALQNRAYVSALGRVVAASAGILVAAPTMALFAPLIGLTAAFGAVAIADQVALRVFPRPLHLTADDGTTVYLGRREVNHAQMRLDADGDKFHLSLAGVSEGEMAELEAAWRRAERVAAIADDLLLPPHVIALLAAYPKPPNAAH